MLHLRAFALAVPVAVAACGGPVAVDVVRVPADGDVVDGRAAAAVGRGFGDDDGADVVDDHAGVDVAALLEANGAGAAFAVDAATVVRNARAAGVVDERGVFTVIDFSQPSTAQRLWTLDVDAGAVLVRDRVSHGSGSNSDDDDAMADRFSNTPGSLQSSLGLVLTAETYEGSNGYSLRLDGLEPSNDNVRDRAIVVHGADYAEDAFVDDNGYLGRSSGCPAVAMSRSAAFIDVIKEGTPLWMWFPDDAWRAGSPFLAD